MDYGPAIRRAREAKGWTRDELARRAGLNAASVSRYESGHRRPSGDGLLAVLGALGVGLEDLFEEEAS